jgi:hypothetical protein
MGTEEKEQKKELEEGARRNAGQLRGRCEIICIRKVNVDRLSSHVLWRLRCCRMGRPSASSWVLSPVEAVPLRVWFRKCQGR